MNEHVDLVQLRDLERVEAEVSPQDAGLPKRDNIAYEKAVTPKRDSVRRPLLALASLIFVGFGCYYGWHYWTVGQFEVSTDDAYVEADSTIVAPKVSGYLREVLVADNQAIKASQTVAQIDDRDYAVAVKQANANVGAARATIDNINASIAQQQPVIEQARSTVALDQANLTFAQQEYDRYTSLANQGSGSVQNAQQAISKLNIAKATLQRDGAVVTAAERQVGVLTAQLARAQAELAHDLAVEEQARLNLSYTTIVAPVDGVIGNRTLRVGQYVQAGTALMSVVPLSATYIIANYKETQLTDVRPGQPVEIKIDSFPGRPLQGIVDSIAPASGQEFALLPPDNATGNFTKVVQRVPVKIKVTSDNPLVGLMRPGMSVEPTIDTRGVAEKAAL
jgi:membrane fusion protein (multidrug efflux system)